MAAGETTVGGIVGFLRMDDDEFNRTVDAAIARIRVLSGMDADVDVRVDTHGAEGDLDRITRRAGEADRSVSRMGGSFNSLRSPAVILAAVTGGIALIGPVAGAATAGVAGLTGVLGTAVLAWKGYQHEIAQGTALGGALQSELDGLSGTLHRLEATAAQAMGPGLIFGLDRLNKFLPSVDSNVSQLGKSLGRAFDISVGGVVSGLDAMMPLLQDGGVYAEQLAQKFADFTQSQDFRDFIAYARQELPEVASAIGSVVKGIVDLGVALAPVGDAFVKVLGQIGEVSSYLAKGIGAVAASSKDFVTWIITGKAPWDAQKGAIEGTTSALEKHAEVSQTSLQAMDAQITARSQLAAGIGTTTDALQVAEGAQRSQADAAAAATRLMQLENDAAGLLKGTLDALNGKTLDVASAQTASASASLHAIDALKAHTKGEKDYGKTLSLSTENGVAARQALEAKARADQQAAEAVAKATGSTKAGTKSLADNKAALEATLKKQGLLTDKVQAYIDKIYKVPKKVPPTQIDVDKTKADAALTALARHLSVVTQPRSVTVTTVLQTIGSGPFSGKKVPAGASAAGGTVGGHGGPTADDQPYWLSTGEEVINARSAAKWRPFLKAINADGLAAGGTVGMAAGGTAGGWAGLDSSLVGVFGKDLGAQVVQAFAAGMGGGKGSVKSVAEQIRTIVSDSAKKASDDLKSLLDEQASYAKDVGGRFSALGDLTGDPSQGGKSFVVGPDGVMREDTTSMAFTGTLSSAIAQTKDFTATIAQLAKLGARTDILQQFLDKGPESAAAAAALAGLGRAGISNVNALQGQLVSASGSLGSLGASAVYGPRVSAARSLMADEKAMEVAVSRAMAPHLAESRKATAESRQQTAQLKRLAGELASALKGAGSGVQLAQRNKPAGR